MDSQQGNEEDGGRPPDDENHQGDDDQQHTRKKHRVSPTGALPPSASGGGEVLDVGFTAGAGGRSGDSGSASSDGTGTGTGTGGEGNENGSNNIVYKLPTVKEQQDLRNDVIDVYRGGNFVFDALFRTSEDTKQHVTSVVRLFQDKYANVPEHDKWWKDDEVLILYTPKFILPSDILRLVSKRLRSDPTFVAGILRSRIVQQVTDELSWSEEVLKTIEVVEETLFHCEHLSDFFDDAVFFDELGRFYPLSIGSLHKTTSIDVWHRAVLSLLERASPRLRDDADFLRGIFLHACQVKASDPHLVLQCASERLKDDPEFILSTIGHDRYHGALHFLSDRLRDDQHFLLRVQKSLLRPKYLDPDHYDGVLTIASEKLCDDETFILKICALTERVQLWSISDRLRSSKAFVIKQIEMSGDYTFLEYSCYLRHDGSRKSCRDDIDIVLACIRAWKIMPDERSDLEDEYLRDLHHNESCFSPLGLASKRLQDNEEVVRSEIAKNPLCICHASERLRSDESIALFALEALRECPPGVRGMDDGYICAAWSMVDESFSSSLRKNLCFISKALSLVPYVIPSDWYGTNEYDHAKFVSIALGGCTVTINGKSFDDFWLHRFGREFYHEELVEFWNEDFGGCREVHEMIGALDAGLFGITNDEDDLLRVGLDRKNRRKKRYDGFKPGHSFTFHDWKEQKWQRVWLIDQKGQETTKQKLPTEVLKCIVGFTGIDSLLKNPAK